MDRPDRIRLAGGTVLALAVLGLGPGCRSTQSEVPPGKPYQTRGGESPVGFSTDPHPSTAAGLAAMYGNRGSGGRDHDGSAPRSDPGDMTLGTPTQDPVTMGMPTQNSYGAPGTSGTNSSSDNSAGLASRLLKTIPSGPQMVEKAPPDNVPGAGGTMGGSYP